MDVHGAPAVDELPPGIRLDAPTLPGHRGHRLPQEGRRVDDPARLRIGAGDGPGEDHEATLGWWLRDAVRDRRRELSDDLCHFRAHPKQVRVAEAVLHPYASALAL